MISRKREQEQLERIYRRNRAELVAIYGRRRVGKTFLVDSVFQGKITFRHAGLSPVEHSAKGFLAIQLQHFQQSLVRQGMPEAGEPKNWLEAFFMLETLLEKKDHGDRQVVFLDELPWLDSPRSGFITAFEAFWNSWGCHRPNLMVIVCGSASSWIRDQLINNHGGLYNRVTYEIKLCPFTLKECEEYFQSEHIALSRYDMLQSYMIFGGIPFYLGYFEESLSFAQTVDKLFFSDNAVLKEEYDRLFASVFDSPEIMKSIVELLHSRSAGFTRMEIMERLGISSGGRLTKCLNALTASDFVIKYQPFGAGKREERYKLTDPFCLFYLHFLKSSAPKDRHFWVKSQNTQAVVTWRGFAFENVCFMHLHQIKRALGISDVQTTSSAWTQRDSEANGTQIDLVIDREDNVVNACEIKFYKGPFTVNKAYAFSLMNRLNLLTDQIPSRKVVRQVLITTYGLNWNEYSDLFSNVITADDLFE